MEIMAGEYGAHSSLNSEHFQRRLGPASENISKFRAIWSKEVGAIWNEIRARVQRGAGQAVASRSSCDDGASSSSRAMVESVGASVSMTVSSGPSSHDGIASSSQDATENAAGGRSHGPGEGVEAVSEAKKEQEHLRTCTTKLKDIFHPGLDEDACVEFLRLVETAQENVTDVIFELGTLSYKAFLGVSGDESVVLFLVCRLSKYSSCQFLVFLAASRSLLRENTLDHGVSTQESLMTTPSISAPYSPPASSFAIMTFNLSFVRHDSPTDCKRISKSTARTGPLAMISTHCKRGIWPISSLKVTCSICMRGS